MDGFNNINFDDIINSETLVVVDFYATWCMPCRMLSPILKQVAEKMRKVDFYNLDISENPDIAKRFRVFSVPTLMAFKNGKVIDSLVGLNSFDEIVDFVKKCDSVEK